jgi:hypothetical protein
MSEYFKNLSTGEIIAWVGIFWIIVFAISRIAGYLRWRYGAPKYESGNEPIDEEKKE